MASKNPLLLALAVVFGILGLLIFGASPISVSSNHILNSTLNGAIGGLLVGLAVALFQQKKGNKGQ